MLFSKYLGFGFHPVLQGKTFGLTALVVQLLGVQPDLSFQQFGYECLLLLSTGIAIHTIPLAYKGIFLQFYDTGRLLTEGYIWEGWGLLKCNYTIQARDGLPIVRNNASGAEAHLFCGLFRHD